MVAISKDHCGTRENHNSQADATPPVLESRRVRLRALRPSDYEWLYDSAMSTSVGFRWRYRGATPSPEQFVTSLWEGVLAQFVVEGCEKKLPRGLVTIFNANFREGFAHISVLSHPDSVGRGHVLEGLGLLIDYAFRVWGFRKLYAESLEVNLRQFASGLGRYFVEEGRLKDHEAYGGAFWDLVVLAIWREAWVAARTLGIDESRGVAPADRPIVSEDRSRPSPAVF